MATAQKLSLSVSVSGNADYPYIRLVCQASERTSNHYGMAVRDILEKARQYEAFRQAHIAKGGKAKQSDAMKALITELALLCGAPKTADGNLQKYIPNTNTKTAFWDAFNQIFSLAVQVVQEGVDKLVEDWRKESKQTLKNRVRKAISDRTPKQESAPDAGDETKAPGETPAVRTVESETEDILEKAVVLFAEARMKDGKVVFPGKYDQGMADRLVELAGKVLDQYTALTAINQKSTRKPLLAVWEDEAKKTAAA